MSIGHEINDQINAGRDTIRRSLVDVRSKIDSRRPLRPAGMFLAGVTVAALAVGVAWIIYRQRRQRSLVQRLQDALPEKVRELPTEVRHQVKRPLERAARTL